MLLLLVLFFVCLIYNSKQYIAERNAKMKKLLSIVLTLLIISGTFGCLTMIASAEDDTWKSDFIASDFTGDTQHIYSGKFYASDGSPDSFAVESVSSFNLEEGFGAAANLVMSNKSTFYLGEYCSMKVGNVEIRIQNIKDQANYEAKLYVGDNCLGTYYLGAAPNGQYRLCANESEIWVLFENEYVEFTAANGNATTYFARTDDVDLTDAHLAFTIGCNRSLNTSRYWSSLILYKHAATKYVSKDVYLPVVNYAGGENAYFAVPDHTTIYTGDRIHLEYDVWTEFTWPDGTVEEEWNIKADNGQVGQPANPDESVRIAFVFKEAGEHYISSASFNVKLITFDVVDRFFAPTSAQMAESDDVAYPDGSDLPFTDKLVSGDAVEIYDNPAVAGVFFTSDIWQAVPLISQELVDLGYSGGEGCQLVNSVVFGNDGKLAFLATDVGGIYKSTDGGANWYLNSVNLNANGATSIVIDPTNNNKVLCIGASSGYDEYNGIYMSTDAGDTWENVYSPAKNNDGLIGAHGDNRIQIAFDPTSYNASLGYCTTIYWSRENNTKTAANNNPSIYKSTDGGYTWKKIANTTSYGGYQIRVAADTGWVYVNNADGLYRSKNGGSSWTRILNQTVDSFDTTAASPSNIYAINKNGYFVSTNYGDTWDSFKGNGFVADGTALSLNVSPINPNNAIYQVYYAAYNHKTMVTNDGGYTWNKINVDTTGMWTDTDGASIQTFDWSPLYENTVMMSDWGGIYKSINGGNDFFWSNAGFNSICVGGEMNFNVNHPEYISIASQDFNGGYSTDGGKTWTYVNWSGEGWGGWTYGSYMIDSNSIITGVATAMFGEETYIAYTHDGGKTITKTSNRVYGKKIGCGALGNDNIAFLGEWRTTDGGYTFTKMTGCDGVFTVDPETGRLFGTNGNKVVTSTDNGATWTEVSSSSIRDLNDIGYSHDTNTIFVTNGSSLYTCQPDFSTTSNTFTRCSVGEDAVTTVAVDPNNSKVVYVGCSNDITHDLRSVWRSLNGGKSWTCISKAADDGRESPDGARKPITMRVNAATSELFVLTSCRGMWKISAPPEWYLESGVDPDFGFSSLKDMIVNDINENTTYNASGYGEDDTYYIYTKEDLNNVRNDLDGMYILMNDIEFTEADFTYGGAFYNGGKFWEPFVTNSSGSWFSGIFYGNGYTIKGLKSSYSGTQSSIFGYSTGLIMKTGFVDCTIESTTNQHNALVTIINDGQILNCYIKDCLVSSQGTNVAMMTVFGSVGRINGCYVDGTLSSSNAAYALINYPTDGDILIPNYYLSSLSPIAAPNYRKAATALSASQMLNQASYADWDFENIWTIDEGKNTPTLRHLVFTEEENKPTVSTSADKKLALGSKFVPKVTVTDTNGQTITADTYIYTSTPDILSVSENGEVTGLASGTGYIYIAEYNTQTVSKITINVSETTLMGDANLNNRIDSSDMLLLQQHALNICTIEGAGWVNCDLNDDKVVDAADLTILQMVIIGLATIE